jgi:hypothetical protein
MKNQVWIPFGKIIFLAFDQSPPLNLLRNNRPIAIGYAFLKLIIMPNYQPVIS